MKKIYSIIVAAIVLASCNVPQQTGFGWQGNVNYPMTAEDEAMLDSIQKKTFRHISVPEGP